jgi:hypothetical protein
VRQPPTASTRSVTAGTTRTGRTDTRLTWRPSGQEPNCRSEQVSGCK